MKISTILMICLVTGGSVSCGNSNSSTGTATQSTTAIDPLNLADSVKYPPLPAQLFLPSDNVWNTPIDNADTDANNMVIIRNLQVGVPDSEQKVIVDLSVPYYAGSNPDRNTQIKGLTTGDGADGNYGVPEDTIRFPRLDDKKPQASDPHLLIIDTTFHKLYELYGPKQDVGQAALWRHKGAAIFDLSRNIPSRQDGYTAADAAGLPVLPGVLRFEELRRGEIKHALRVTLTAGQTVNAHISPATHNPITGNAYNPTSPITYLPMGARLRLKSSFNDTNFPAEAKTIIRCLKKYGLIIADIGPAFNISGTSDPRFDNRFSGYESFRLDSPTSTLRLYDNIKKQDISWGNFEVVKMGKTSTAVRQYP